MKPVRNGAADAGAIILAGGEGSRLLPLTRRIAGHDLPEQFFSLIGQETLLEQTRRRISRSIPEEKTVTVRARSHEHFYAPLIAGIPRNLAIQPVNRDTAAAILFGLFRLAALGQARIAAIFPSDHYTSDDTAFTRHVDAAIYAMPSLDHKIVLRGIASRRAEAGYGWILESNLRRPASTACQSSAFGVSWKNRVRAWLVTFGRAGCCGTVS